jgi:hypothetical protein
MSEAITVAFITGGLSLLGTIITVLMTSNKTREELRVSQAIMETKIVELTREVREHNGFAKRMPVIEEQINTINKRLDAIEAREDDLK